MIQTNAIQITPGILNLIARIDEFKGAWRASFFPEKSVALAQKDEKLKGPKITPAALTAENGGYFCR